MTGSQGRSGVKNVKESSTREGAKIVEKNSSVFGKYSDAELVTELRALALDPCHPENSRGNVGPLFNQILRVREAMALADHQFPRRKRQLQQFVKEKLNASPGSKSGSPSMPNPAKLGRGLVSHASSKSCLYNSVLSAESIEPKILLESHSSSSLLTSDNKLLMNQISSESSFMDDGTKWTSLGKDLSSFVDSDESANYSNPLSPENSIPQEVPSLNLDEMSHSSNSIVLDKQNRKDLQPVRQSIRLLNFIGDHLRRMAVPVGPRFQADVPDWIGPCNGENSDSPVLRWLGTQIWPPEVGTPKFNARAVGKGRPEVCPCHIPTSAECIRRHVLEERLRLQSDLGAAFLSWKFDEIGEHVSNSWTLQEQQNFESLARRKKQVSEGRNLLKNALKWFPLKCRKTIVNYYFNVYIPRRMSLQRRLSLKEVDSDGDEVEDYDSLDMQNRFDGRASLVGKSKNVKTQYLRRPY